MNQTDVQLAGVDIINLVQFSHHDLGWHKNSFVAETVASNEEISLALDLMRSNPNFTWTHEYARYLIEYLKAYPERLEELRERVREGRFDIGAGYSQPQTSFVTGEMLVRQFLYGKKWVEKQFPGSRCEVYYNTDIPGLAAQMPQILAKSGVDYLYLSRSWDFADYRVNEFKKYKAPDGSSVYVIFMNQYPDNVDAAGGAKTFTEQTVEALLDRITDYEEDISREKLGHALPLILSSDCRPPKEYREQVDTWNQYTEGKNLPEIRYSTMKDALRQVFLKTADFSWKGSACQETGTLSGEWPNKWFYENSASDHNAFTSQREAERYLRAAETLGVLRAILTGGFENYPAEALEQGWRHCDFACHGFAPTAGIEEFRREYKEAFRIGKTLYNESLEWLVSRVKAKAEPDEFPIVVYNNLSWQRDDIVLLDRKEEFSSLFRIVDNNDREIPYQLTYDGKVVFTARDIPAMGYRTYYVQGNTYIQENMVSSAAVSSIKPGSRWDAPFENRFYILYPVAEGGALEAVVDKENHGQSLFTSKDGLHIGEVFSYTYDGMGAGEQLYIWQPYNAVSHRESFSPWKCVESGPVRTVMESRAQSDAVIGPAVLRVIVYEALKKIDFEIALENVPNTDRLQIRLMFPVNTGSMFGAVRSDGYCYADVSDVRVRYEVPFGITTVGDEVLEQYCKYNDNTAPNGVGWKRCGSAKTEGINTYEEKNDINSAIRPREAQNWISASSKTEDFSVTISSYNLGWDYQDSRENAVKSPVLQPILLCNSCTCHGDGYIWNQPGAHCFRFSMTSGSEEEENGYRMGIAANNPLDARIQEELEEQAFLSEEFQGISMDKPNVLISAVKKAEERDDQIIIRLYEAEGHRDTGLVRVTLPENCVISKARQGNLLEKETGKAYAVSGNTVNVDIPAWSIETIMMTVK